MLYLHRKYVALLNWLGELRDVREKCVSVRNCFKQQVSQLTVA